MRGELQKPIVGLILALDTSAKATGYVLGQRGVVETFGIQKFKQHETDSEQVVGQRIGVWLNAIVAEYGLPGLIAYEAPMNANTAVQYLHNRPSDVALIHGVLMGFHTWAGEHGVREEAVNVQTHRRITTGETKDQRVKRTGADEDDAKAETIDAINKRAILSRPLKFSGLDHNIADAASVFVWACHELEGIWAGQFLLAGQVLNVKR